MSWYQGSNQSMKDKKRLKYMCSTLCKGSPEYSVVQVNEQDIMKILSKFVIEYGFRFQDILLDLSSLIQDC